MDLFLFLDSIIALAEVVGLMEQHFGFTTVLMEVYFKGRFILELRLLLLIYLLLVQDQLRIAVMIELEAEGVFLV